MRIYTKKKKKERKEKEKEAEWLSKAKQRTHISLKLQAVTAADNQMAHNGALKTSQPPF